MSRFRLPFTLKKPAAGVSRYAAAARLVTLREQSILGAPPARAEIHPAAIDSSRAAQFGRFTLSVLLTGESPLVLQNNSLTWHLTPARQTDVHSMALSDEVELHQAHGSLGVMVRVQAPQLELAR